MSFGDPTCVLCKPEEGERSLIIETVSSYVASWLDGDLQL